MNPQQQIGNDQHLMVRIITPKDIIYQGGCSSVSSTNSMGKFDILPMHANMVTLIKNAPIIIRPLDKPQLTFNFPLAIIYVNDNIVSIYTDIQLKLKL